MPEKTQKNADPKAEYPDYDFLDKPLDGEPPGSTVEIDGELIDTTKLDDYVSGKSSKLPKAERPS